MKNFAAVTLAACCLAGCGALEPGPVTINKIEQGTPSRQSANEAKEDRQAPVLASGQKWTYRRVDLWRNKETERFRQELFFPDDKLWIVRWSILNSDKYSRMGSVTGELFDTRNHSFADASMSGHYEPLNFPLSEGKSWTFDYAIPSKHLQVRQTATVRGWETVEVAAGRFRALRITHEGMYTARDAKDGIYSWSGRIKETYWYAPSARRVVKREYQDTNGEGGLWDHWQDELLDMTL